MAAERKKKKIPKTESLTIRLDPKVRFALEFVARIKGQTITKVIERTIVSCADSELISKASEADWNAPSLTWKDYWDVNEGIRAINLARDEDTHPDFDEEEMWDFIKTHAEYFFHDRVSLSSPKRENFDVLWPIIPQLLAIWDETKSTDRRKVAAIIEDSLKKAGISHGKHTASLDEDIPF